MSRIVRLLAGSLVATLAAAQTAPPPDHWPKFHGRAVLTDPAKMKYNPTGEFIFPSVFHAGEYLADPLGEWYLYYAPHESPGGVSLMYAEDIEGPWTEYANNPVIANVWQPHYTASHVSSPDAAWNEQSGRLFVYFHGDNTQTRWAETDDGVNFDYGGVAVNNAMSGSGNTETSYARVFRHPCDSCDYAYGMFYMGVVNDVRRIRLAESVDGRTWEVDPEPVILPGDEEQGQVSGGNLWEWDGQLYVVYHAASGNTYARTIDKTLRNVGSTPIVVFKPENDNTRVASPDIVSVDGETYLFFEKGARLDAVIAYAKDISGE